MNDELQQDINEVKEKIKGVEGDIEDQKKKLKENENILNETRAQLHQATDEKERERLEKKEERLEKEKEHLEKEKELLREKENLYLQRRERLEQQQQATGEPHADVRYSSHHVLLPDNEAALVNQFQEMKVNVSSSLARDRICTPFPIENEGEVLSDVKVLKASLNSSLPCRIPYNPNSFVQEDMMTSAFDNSVFEVAPTATNGILVSYFTYFEERCGFLSSSAIVSEETVQGCITTITGMMWKRLLDIKPLTGVVFEATYNKMDFSGSTQGSCRPDECDYLNNFLVCKSEHKDSVIMMREAKDELAKKLVVYNQHDYGHKIVYLPVIAVAGTQVEFGLVDVRDKAYHTVSMHDVRLHHGRAQCFVSSINTFRLILTMAPHIPAHPYPLFKTVKNVKFNEDHVKKNISNSTCPRELYKLLEKGAVPSAVTVQPCGDQSYVRVYPAGVRIPDKGEGLSIDDVRCAVKAVLQCLRYLHGKGFVHRDVRWANVIRHFTHYSLDDTSECQFLLIDFEFAAMAGDTINVGRYIHSDVVPIGESYTYCHDLKLVAKLIVSWRKSNDLQLDELTKSFVSSIREASTAEECLKHEWLK